MSEDTESEAESEDTNPLRRAADVLFFGPLGMAVTALEDFPALVTKGRERVETEISNARVVGEFVVQQGQRELSQFVGQLLNRDSPEPAAPEHPADADAGADASADGNAHPGADAHQNSTAPTPAPKPDADPADTAIVEQALAGYDTLSASQVVRRLESLGPDELRAVHRHEASHRNRRTILNRTHQLLAAE